MRVGDGKIADLEEIVRCVANAGLVHGTASSGCITASLASSGLVCERLLVIMGDLWPLCHGGCRVLRRISQKVPCRCVGQHRCKNGAYHC